MEYFDYNEDLKRSIYRLRVGVCICVSRLAEITVCFFLIFFFLLFFKAELTITNVYLVHLIALASHGHPCSSKIAVGLCYLLMHLRYLPSSQKGRTHLRAWEIMRRQLSKIPHCIFFLSHKYKRGEIDFFLSSQKKVFFFTFHYG